MTICHKEFEYRFKTFKQDRMTKRGFCDFYVSLYELCQPTSEHFHTIVEAGVSGGGTHEKIARCIIDGDHVIGGIELFHPSVYKEGYPQQQYDRQMDDYRLALSKAEEFPCIKFLHNTSAYDDETPQKILDLMEVDSIDLFIDDAATDWPRMQNSLPLWKNYISDHGIYCTEVPDGMGVDTWWNMTHNQHMQNFQDLAKHGMVIFDMEEYKTSDEKDWNAHYFGVWTKDWNLYKPVIEKFKHNLVIGQENIKYE